MAGAILNAGFDMLSLACLFWAVGIRISAARFIAGYGIPQLLGKLTLILGGAGVVETSMAGLYTVLGVSQASAVVVGSWLSHVFILAAYPHRSCIDSVP